MVYANPNGPNPRNRWSEIKKARRKILPFRLWLKGFIEGCLVVLVTLLVFGWMLWWKEIHKWLVP